MPFLAASPDRVINDAAIMEVKCPFTAKDKMISPTTVPYLKPVQGSDTLVLDTNHVYYYQVQGQLLCSGRGMCYFVVYTLVDMKIIVVQYDRAFVDIMVQQLQTFYEDFFKAAVIETHFYHK